MNKKNSQILNTVFIVAGAALLIYSFTNKQAHVAIKISGLITIMIGLYRATNYWVETKDDHLEDNDENPKK